MKTERAVKHNQESHRFEMSLDSNETAFISYKEQTDGVMNLLHTEVPESAKGKGIGGRLVQATLDMAKAEGKKVVPSCPFISDFIQQHPEYKSVVA